MKTVNISTKHKNSLFKFQFLVPSARAAGSPRSLSVLSSASQRLCGRTSRSHIILFCLLMLTGSLVLAAEPKPYHYKRDVEPIVFSNPATLYQIKQAANELRPIVKGYPIKVWSQKAVEYESVAWGYDNPQAPWSCVTNSYMQHKNEHPDKFYDNVGWVKGTRKFAKNGDEFWGGYLWLMQNTLEFNSSTSSVWISSQGVTNDIASVIVGSLGDYCPEQYVTEIGPRLDKTFPGIDQGTNVVLKADTNAYYRLRFPITAAVNDDDSDGDGIPDYADGYGLANCPIPGSGTSTNDDSFIPWYIGIPVYMEPTETHLRISYNASDPNGVISTLIGANYTFTPAAGDLRLWQKQGQETRTISDYIAPGTYPVTNLGLTDSTEYLTIWLEAVTPVADSSITIEVTTNLVDYICLDAVDATTVDFLDFDWMEGANEVLHHTSDYKTNALVLRRAQKLRVKATVSKGYSEETCDVWFQAVHEFDGPPKTNNIPTTITDFGGTNWYCRLLSTSKNPDESSTLDIEINIPTTNTPIGEYKWRALASHKADINNVMDTTNFPGNVIILFNPWDIDDTVYMANSGNRAEYVMSTSGRIWRGTRYFKTVKPWRYDQFEAVSLRVLLYLLKGENAVTVPALPAVQRADPVLVSRHLSRQADGLYESGVVWGKWPRKGAVLPWAGGDSPNIWSGSKAILTKYDATHQGVKYGQCWVYGGVLTTLCRAVGIPTRPITNYDSAHDKNANKEIDVYLKVDGTFDELATEDSIWNYHVWCDAWMKRPGLIGQDGWQSIDATPQEPSGGVYQLGPAPHAAIKADLGGKYDVDFVFSEVNADKKIRQKLTTGGHVLVRTDVDAFGHDISTKTVGVNTRNDITSAYK